MSPDHIGWWYWDILLPWGLLGRKNSVWVCVDLGVG